MYSVCIVRWVPITLCRLLGYFSSRFAKNPPLKSQIKSLYESRRTAENLHGSRWSIYCDKMPVEPSIPLAGASTLPTFAFAITTEYDIARIVRQLRVVVDVV